MIPVIGLGAGGHAAVVVDILQLTGQYSLVGLLDPARVGQTLAGVPVLGGDEELPRLRAGGVTAGFVGVGSVGNSHLRQALYEKLLAAGFVVVRAIHPAAVVARFTSLGDGVTIMAGAILNPGGRVDVNVIINTGAIVDHDCEIGAHAHISPGAVLCGGVRVGAGAHVGAGAVVRQGLVIGPGAIVGAGAVVVKDVLPQTVVVGNPARPTQSDHGASLK